MLTVATFRTYEDVYIIGDESDAKWDIKANLLWKFDFRHTNPSTSLIQYLIMCWIIGIRLDNFI